MKVEYITREECYKSNEKIMEEIEKIKGEVEKIHVTIAELPEKIIEKMDNRYVSQDAFKPIRLIVYGLVGIIMASVLAYILNHVFANIK